MAQQTLERVSRSVVGHCGICRRSGISPPAKFFIPSSMSLELRLPFPERVTRRDEKRLRMQVIQP